MAGIRKIQLGLKALRELGPVKLGQIGLYRLGLRSGYFRWQTDRAVKKQADLLNLTPSPIFDLPDPNLIREILGPAGVAALLQQADQIVGGHFRLFGGPLAAIDLTPPGTQSHWTFFSHPETTDIKYIWEPARFGWALILGQAFWLTQNEAYAQAFWHYFAVFQTANPVNRGPNWESAQEVALRLMAFSFSLQVFRSAAHTTPEEQRQLTTAIAQHAARIPATIIYARAQNNNHLLSEAAGLITAGVLLPNHPAAHRWAALGWRWFNWGLNAQISADGVYMQQSTNYHRLMLQLALWVTGLKKSRQHPYQLSNPALEKLQLATRWLLQLTDGRTGRVPNLGPNDGAYIFPFTPLPFDDYRPVLQAASQTFLAASAFESGPWDALRHWFACDVALPGLPANDQENPLILKSGQAWAYLRAVQYHDRPGHADQLHLDLWWRGENIAQDAGTYLYNALPPWQNALTHTAVHNTVLLNGREQMTPVSRFLYLDKSSAAFLSRVTAPDDSWEKITAWHDGYRKMGVVHTRAVTAHRDGRWVVVDELTPFNGSATRQTHTTRLHWLLPDWPYEWLAGGAGLKLKSPQGWLIIQIQTRPASSVALQLVRAGVLLHGHDRVEPTWGWASKTYGHKEPALSLACQVVGRLPIAFQTEWILPKDD